MLSASQRRLLGYFLIVLATVFLPGCDKPINLALGQNHKIALYPTPGQHLVWMNGIQVQFLGPSPCTEPTGAWLTECHVKSNPGTEMHFFYICKDYGCSDPEVDVGSGNGGVDDTKSKSSKVMDTVGVSCSAAGAVTLFPPDLPEASQNAPLKPGVVVNWVSVGEIKNWSVAFDAAGVCEDPSIQSSGNTMCTIKQGLAPNKYTYKSSSTSCATLATGSLTTVAP